MIRRRPSPTLAAARLLVGICASLLVPLVPARATDARLEVEEAGNDLIVARLLQDCGQVLVAPSALRRQNLEQVQISYRRNEGCRHWPLDREMLGFTQLLDALMAKMPDRAKISALFWGRIEQPEFRQRIAGAALDADLIMLTAETPLYRRLPALFDERDVFAELRAAFAAHGFSLKSRGFEKLERVRGVELAQHGIDPAAFSRPMPAGARVPIAALMWFKLEPLAR